VPLVEVSVSFAPVPVSTLVMHLAPLHVVLADQAAVCRLLTGSGALVDLVTTATWRWAP
jgi:hypothetical protein